MAEPTCPNPGCPHRGEVDYLRRELRAVYRLLGDRRADLARCPRHPKGERCALPAGHEGGCKWERGD
jgi:hypothetical protein